MSRLIYRRRWHRWPLVFCTLRQALKGLCLYPYTQAAFIWKKHTSRKIFNKTTCEHTPPKTRPLFISLFIFRFLRRFSCRDFDISRPIFRAQKWKLCKMGRKIICIKETPAKCHTSKRCLALRLSMRKKLKKFDLNSNQKWRARGFRFLWRPTR